MFLFGAETWVLSAAIAKKLVGVHVRFLQHVTMMKAKIQKGGSWRNMVSEILLQVSGTQPLQTYIERRQATVA